MPTNNDHFTPYRPWTLKAADRLIRFFDRFGSRTLSLDADKLMRKAQKKTGLSDFGDDSFREPLEILCQSSRTGKPMTTMGRLMGYDNLLYRLKNRLKIEAELKKHPGILDQEIHQPIIIAGLARTGTTLLQRLLAQDPANRSPRNWEMNSPVPPPKPATYESDPRIKKDRFKWAILHHAYPKFKAIHEVGAELPDECLSLMANDLISGWFVIGNDSGYLQWILNQDLLHSYQLHKRQLQLLQWNFPPLRWVLKSPWHLMRLDSLLEVYPDAKIIQTHRDPTQALASVASYMINFRSVNYHNVDPKAIGKEWLDLTTTWFTRGMAAREEAEKRPDSQCRFQDIYYKDFVADPIGTIETMYQGFNMELCKEAKERMALYIKNNPRNKHGSHSYSLEQFGLDRETVLSHFAPYYKRFNLTP
jgi:Sulfotransferase family